VLRTATHTATWQSSLALISRWLSMNTTMRSVIYSSHSSSLVFICHDWQWKLILVSFVFHPRWLTWLVVHLFIFLKDCVTGNDNVMLINLCILRFCFIQKKILSLQQKPGPKRHFSTGGDSRIKRSGMLIGKIIIWIKPLKKTNLSMDPAWFDR